MTFRLFSLSAQLAAIAFFATPVFSQDRPLLVEGKSTVFQRVLTRSDVTALSAPNGQSVAELNTFSPLYVYAVQDGWVQAGHDVGGDTFWVPQDKTVKWTQNIVASFTNSANRDRQLLMDSEQALIDLMNHEAVDEMHAALLQEADSNSLRDNSGVNSVEPQEYVDIRQQFYVMPILDFKQDFHPMSFADNLSLNVASVPEGADAEDESTLFEVGIVFVLDTTQSMGPFIDRTTRMLSDIVTDLRASEFGKRVHFGAVAFRDNPEASPGLEYRSKTIIPLERRDDPSEVIAAIAGTEEATVSSPGFTEDSIAGVLHAIDETDWTPNNNGYGARYVILVTDAGPKRLGDPNALSAENARDPRTLASHAAEKGVGILTLHLKTDAGSGNHAQAEESYRTLSRYDGAESYYYAVDRGDPDSFQTQAEGIVRDLAAAVQEGIDANGGTTPSGDAGLARLGNAMRLAWLGRTQGTQAPDIISSWVSQYDVVEGSRLAFTPRLLVTKNEMATIAEVVNEFIELGEQIESTEDAQAFHNNIRQVILRMAQNPDRLVNPEAEGLGDAMEFLEDLPYRSQILNISESRWLENAMQRRSVLDNLRPKLAQYRSWLQTADVWTALYEGAPDGDLVYAMPFQLLP